jgi:hypothetical protein
MLQSLFYLMIALHVSEILTTHHQEHKTTVPTVSGNRYTVHTVHVCQNTRGSYLENSTIVVWKTNNITEQRTPWSRVLWRKPVNFQRIKTFPELHGTLNFITMQDMGLP